MEAGSDSPRSIRNYHKGGSGSLTGGGIQKIYSGKAPDVKSYKRKLDSRLGQVILGVLLTMATLLALYGFIHGGVHEPVYTYINRTHQIVLEVSSSLSLETECSSLSVHNASADEHKDKKWLTSEELEGYSEDFTRVHSTIWFLFIGNILFALILSPVLLVILCGVAEGQYVKLLLRGVLILCLLFLIAQLLFLLSPLLFTAMSFSSTVDRLFIEGEPRDEYQRRNIESDLSCQFETSPQFVQFDLEIPCIPRLKNSLLPAYAVFIMILIDIFPFAFAVFTFAWTACIKDKKAMRNVRNRVEVNSKRRVPIPTSQPRENGSSSMV